MTAENPGQPGPWSRPPFEPGNTASMRHGARSQRVLAPIAERLTAELATEAPWTARPAFAAEVATWAWAEARSAVLRAWIDEHSLVSGEAVAAAGELARAESRAATSRDRLGLNPMGLARLLATVGTAVGAGAAGADALDQLKAEGARIVEARAAALAAGEDET